MQVTLDAGHSGPVTHPREPGPEFPLMSAAWASAVRPDTGRTGNTVGRGEGPGHGSPVSRAELSLV